MAVRRGIRFIKPYNDLKSSRGVPSGKVLLVVRDVWSDVQLLPRRQCFGT